MLRTAEISAVAQTTVVPWRENHRHSQSLTWPGIQPGERAMRALDNWRLQDLADDSRAILQELLHTQRAEPDDHATRDLLLEAFMATLTEPQLRAFTRLLRELTEVVH